MENINESVVNEVKQTEVSSATTAPKSNGSDKKLIIKIVVGVLIFLAVVGIAVFMFWYSLANKIVDESKDSLNSIVNIGQSLVDEALDESNMNKLEENMNKVNSVVTSNGDSNTKTSVTVDEFAETVKLKGLEVADITSVFNAQFDPDVKKGCLAKTADYKIEFYELNNESDATYMYNGNKSKFESQKGSTSSYFTVSKNNYNTYTLTTNGRYQYISRVDNTFLYIDVAEEYKDAVKNIVNELGY